MKNASMFMRMLLRSAIRSGRAVTSLLALAVLAAAATALLTIYTDVDAKLNREFRQFGANLIITTSPNGSLPVAEIATHLGNADSTVPYTFAVVKTSDGRPLVASGTFISRALRMNPAWKVELRNDTEAPLVGKRVLQRLAPDGLELEFRGRQHVLHEFNILETGGPEDSRVYIPLHAFLAWTGLSINTLEISVSGTAEQVQNKAERLQAAFPDLEVRPVRQLIEAETSVLGKSQAVFLAVTALISVLVAFCVLATFTASVLERRRDFALMKALGCSGRALGALFIVEAGSLAVAGAVSGFAIGTGLALLIGKINFHAAFEPHFEVLPGVIAVTVAVALIGAFVPLISLRHIQPAVMLRGD
jgi:putative ABC transport system permease protein